MKNLFGSALLNSVSKDRNVSSGLKCPVVCHWHPYSGLNFVFVFEETQLTLLVKQNKYIHCKWNVESKSSNFLTSSDNIINEINTVYTGRSNTAMAHSSWKVFSSFRTSRTDGHDEVLFMLDEIPTCAL